MNSYTAICWLTVALSVNGVADKELYVSNVPVKVNTQKPESVKRIFNGLAPVTRRQLVLDNLSERDRETLEVHLEKPGAGVEIAFSSIEKFN